MKVHKSTGSRTCGQVFFFVFQQVVRSFLITKGDACGQINVSFEMHIQTGHKLKVSKARHNREKAEV